MKNKTSNLTKLFIPILLSVIILISLISLYSFCNFAIAEEKIINNNNLNDNERLLYDFANNKYILKEQGNYYSITHYTTQLLIEENDGIGFSPYENYEKIWYCGPMNYFYELNNKIYSIKDNEELIVTKDIIDYCNQFNEFMINQFKNQNKKKTATYDMVTKIDYYELKYPNFFPNLNTSQYNTDGSCGYVAAASLLSYYDYCYGENSFINSKYWLKKNGDFMYSRSLCNDLKSYGKPNSKGEYPATADTIKSVMKKYFKDRNQTNVTHYSWLGCFTTNLMLCDSIKKNNPVILFSYIYNPIENGKSPIGHAVVVYKAGVTYVNGSTIFSYWMHYGMGTAYNNIHLTNNVTNFTVQTSYYINVK